MSSSSSSAPSSQSLKKYDVFISFRGEDTRFSFTSHLHDALRRNQIDTYIDYRLEKGDEVWPSLEKAIEDSTLFLVIFSENYASSTWCLKELSKILECSENEAQLVVMPVFYRVDPSHVRKQSGSYQKSFEEQERKSIISKQQLQKWREDLTHASNLSGWDCSFHRNEAELIKEIVRCVLQKLSSRYQSECYLKDLIGIRKRLADVELLLNKGPKDDVRVIGIWGMGGIGKTTLAKALFHKWCFAYKGFCFLDNVREESKRCGIAALREKLVSSLLEDKESHIGMLGESISPYAMSRLGRKKVFIVLDDVDDNEQLEKLARRYEFESGSKILITTRDKQVLGKEVDTYVVEALNPDEALNLFSMKACTNGYTDPKMIELAEKVTHYAVGNPLALIVLGSLLRDKNQEAWESQLEKLQKLPCPRIDDILRWSFEGLDYEERNIFLHIACFFNDYNVDDVKSLLNACGYSTTIGLERLEDKTLLNIYGGRVYMHHLINEMGRQIVREESLNDPKRCNRLWNPSEISEILKECMGSEAIEGMMLNLSEVEEMWLSPKAFCSMPNLKFLIFHQSFDDEVGKKLNFSDGIVFLPNKLRLLHWVGCPLKSLPTTFKAEHLVQIEMHNSNLTKLWNGVQNLVNLRKIDMQGSEELIELPDFSKAIKLAEVNLRYCSKLRTVHPSIFSLDSLRRLLLIQCKALTSLTSNAHPKSLSELYLEGGPGWKRFYLTSKDEFFLDLSGTAMNDELCSSSGHLHKIYSLFARRCKTMTSLQKLFELRTLRRLHASFCNKLASKLRFIFGEMHALEDLSVTDCSELFELPENISSLPSLRFLDLSRTNIETLPLSIKHLSNLQHLYLRGCKRLRSLPELPPSILALSTWNCTSIEIIHLPLTNEDREGKEKWMDNCESTIEKMRIDGPSSYFEFTNCVMLDAQSIKAAEAKLLLEINKAIYKRARIDYPGERVPEWFIYRSNTQSHITVDLSSIPQPWDGGFIFCAVISRSQTGTDMSANWFVDGQYGSSASVPLASNELSDHIFLWYDPYSSEIVQRMVEAKRREAQSSTYHPLIQIQFTVDRWTSGHYENVEEVKECGACPTSAIEYQNYIKQFNSALHPHSNSNAMGVASRKRKYHICDEFEELDSEFKSCEDE